MDFSHALFNELTPLTVLVGLIVMELFEFWFGLLFRPFFGFSIRSHNFSPYVGLEQLKWMLLSGM